MHRKLVAIVVATLAFFVGAYVARRGVDWLRKEPAVAAEIAARPWVEQSFGVSDVAFDSPWALEAQQLELPPQLAQLIKRSETLSHEADGLSILVSHIESQPGVPVSLEGAADGALANLKTVPGTLSVKSEKKEDTVLNQRAIQLMATIERSRGVPLLMRGLVFTEGPELYQIVFISRADQTIASDSWERIVKSIRRVPA